MPDGWKGFSIPAKVTALSAALFLVSIGLCAVGGNFMSGNPGFLTTAGILCFFASIAGLFVGIVWMVVAAIGGVRR
jgi:hypothetical protein